MKLKLNIERVKGIHFEQYEQNFTFIVNDTEYYTSRIVADLLSPKISELHYSDPSNNEFFIHTKNPGNFQNVLKLVNFDTNEIQETDIPFLSEILEILNSQMIQIDIPEINVTKDNALDLLCQYENEFIFSSRFQKVLDFVSSHLYEINDDENRFKSLKKDTIEKIISNEQLVIKSEDQFLSFISGLCQEDPTYYTFYEYIDFLNVSTTEIEKFLSIFDYNDMTSGIWQNISKRLKQQISIQSNKSSSGRYKPNGLSLLYEQNNEFKGVFYHLQNNGNIHSEINITSSPICSNNETYSPKNVLQFNNNNYFESDNVNNAFICFDFKNRKLCPTGYTIRSSNMNSIRPKSWAIEGSNDNSSWVLIDEQKNTVVLNASGSHHTFQISSSSQFRYIRLRQTDHGYNEGQNGNPRSDYWLVIDSFEFYGYLFE